MHTDTGVEALLGEAGWLRALAASLLRDGADADDAVQEVWSAALRSPPDRGRPARPWLGQVLRNAIRTAARGGRRRRAREEQLGALADPAAPDAAGLLERMQLHRRLAELVTQMEEPYRTTLILRYYEGKPAVEIARAEGVPDGTIRWRVSEGLRRLREQLDRDCDGKRERWVRALLPLAGGRRAAPSTVRRHGPILVAATAVGAAVVAVAVSKGSAVQPGSLRAAETTGPAGRPTPGATAPQSRQPRQQATTFFKVVVPALGSAASTPTPRTLDDVIIDSCLEMSERTYACRDEAFQAMLANVEPSRRARVREVQLAGLTEAGSGPLDRRRAYCARRASEMDPQRKEAMSRLQPRLQACYRETDCKQMLACMRALVEARRDGGTAAKP